MGLFDFFLSDERKIKKHHRRLTNRDAQPEDRELSAQWLADHGSHQALLALLSRFDMNLDHNLKNLGEKEFVYDLALRQGDDLLEPLQAWLRKCKHVGMPLRLHEELAGREDTVELVYELLEAELTSGDAFKPDKKKKLLVWLADVRRDDVIERAEPFLDDFDEGVRYAAAEAIIAQESDEGRAPLLERLVHPEEDSNRLKVRICEVFAARRWSVADADGVAEALPGGYAVQNDRIVKA